MDRRQISHDILNMLERLRIMHDLVKDQNYKMISKEELEIDLKEALKQLEQNFQQFLQ
jgi:hypothetical protein